MCSVMPRAVLWFYVVEETGESKESLIPWISIHYPATNQRWEPKPDCSGDK